MAMIPAAATSESVRVDFPVSRSTSRQVSELHLPPRRRLRQHRIDTLKCQSTVAACENASRQYRGRRPVGQRVSRPDSPWSTWAITDMLRMLCCLFMSSRILPGDSVSVKGRQHGAVCRHAQKLRAATETMQEAESLAYWSMVKRTAQGWHTHGSGGELHLIEMHTGLTCGRNLPMVPGCLYTPATGPTPRCKCPLQGGERARMCAKREARQLRR